MMGGWGLYLFLILLAGETPRLILDSSQDLMLALPTEILQDETVSRQLSSGLTTTMILTLRGKNARGKSLRGGARIDIRFEPWDEVYLVKVWHYHGEIEEKKLPSMDALADWLAAGTARVLSIQANRDEVWRFEVGLKVMPFSKLEQADTQRWFTKTLSNNASGGVLDLIFASSIKRKTSKNFFWRMDFVP